jgi:hypothetical protein
MCLTCTRHGKSNPHAPHHFPQLIWCGSSWNLLQLLHLSLLSLHHPALTVLLALEHIYLSGIDRNLVTGGNSVQRNLSTMWTTLKMMTKKHMQCKQSALLRVRPIPGLLQMQCTGLTRQNGKQLPCWNWTLTRSFKLNYNSTCLMTGQQTPPLMSERSYFPLDAQILSSRPVAQHCQGTCDQPCQIPWSLLLLGY